MLNRMKNDGWITLELMTAATLLIMVMGALAFSIRDTGKYNKLQLTKQRCVSDGQAQLDSIAMTGKEIDTDRFERLWSGITYQVAKTPGKNQWENLKLVTVTTSGKSNGRQVNIELSRYMPGKGEY